MLLLGTDEGVTESAVNSLEKIEIFGKGIAQEVGIPPWGLVAILIGKEAHAPRHTTRLLISINRE